MPPKGEKLSDQQIADLTAWVKMGAPDPRKKTPRVSKLSGLTDEARRTGPISRSRSPTIPTVKNVAWCMTPVDAFILEKLEEKGMVARRRPPTKEALLRRATYDLIGLPPTPDGTRGLRRDGQLPGRLREGRRSPARLARTTASAGAASGSIPPATPTPSAATATSASDDYRYPVRLDVSRLGDQGVQRGHARTTSSSSQQLAADKLPNNPTEQPRRARLPHRRRALPQRERHDQRSHRRGDARASSA